MFFCSFVFLCVTSSVNFTGFYTEDEPKVGSVFLAGILSLAKSNSQSCSKASQRSLEVSGQFVQWSVRSKSVCSKLLSDSFTKHSDSLTPKSKLRVFNKNLRIQMSLANL